MRFRQSLLVMVVMAAFAAVLAGPSPQVQAEPGLADPLDATISYWEKRREQAWDRAQLQKSSIPMDSKWPGAVGAEANQSMGFASGADEVLAKLRSIRDIDEPAERAQALKKMQEELAGRRTQHWQQVEEKKRSLNPDYPDRFGAELNQLTGMVEAFDEAIASVSKLDKTLAPTQITQGAFAGPVVLRSQLSAARGTLKLSVQGNRVTGAIQAKSRYKDGSLIEQTATVKGTISPEGAIKAQVSGTSKYVAADPDKPFSYLPGVLHNYKFAGDLSGTLVGESAKGKLSLRAAGKKSNNVTLTSDWTLSPAP